MNWYLQVWRNYAVFSGRARRKEYWMFSLFHGLFAILAIIIDLSIGTGLGELGYGFVYIFYILAGFIPNLAVTVRRLHDVGKSGAMIFISLIPVIGFIWLIVLMATESDYGSNQYGANPKEFALA